MRRPPALVLLPVLAAGALLAAVTAAAGLLEGLVLVGAIAWVAATAWFPPRVARGAGTAYLGALVFLFGRFPLGPARGAVLALAVAAAAAWALPTRVHRRVAYAVPLLVLLVYVVAVLMYLAPGSPFAGERGVSAEVEAAQRARFAVADTPFGFFANYLGRLVSEGSLGDSLKVQGRSVLDLLLPALPVSLTLGILALLLAVGLGLLLGVRAGLRPNSAADHGSMALAMVGVSVPNFVLGAALLLLFSLHLGWLPVAGWGTPAHLVLPTLTLALPHAAYVARLARTGTLEAMQQEFVRTARSKGLPEREVVWKHALPAAVLPVVSYLGPAAAGVLTGSFVVEHLFGIPGMGPWFVRGATGRDYAVVLGTALIYFSLLTFFNLLVDLAYAWLDPRVREER